MWPHQELDVDNTDSGDILDGSDTVSNRNDCLSWVLTCK